MFSQCHGLDDDSHQRLYQRTLFYGNSICATSIGQPDFPASVCRPVHRQHCGNCCARKTTNNHVQALWLWDRDEPLENVYPYYSLLIFIGEASGDASLDPNTPI